MAIFGKKTKEERDISEFPSSFAPDLSFPEFPEDDNPFRETKVPSYSSAGQKEQRDFQQSNQDEPRDYSDLLNKPIINHQMGMQQAPQATRPFPRPIEDSQRQGPFGFGMPSSKEQIFRNEEMPEHRMFHEEKPIFVKIDDYEEAIYTLDKIRAKLKEADRILEELNKIRAEEEKQLEEWKQDLSTVKEKLLMIDKQLFENA